MKANLKFFPQEYLMIQTAMTAYSEDLKGFNRLLFDIALDKINESDGEVQLDGMEMIEVTRALRKRGWFYFNKGKKLKAETYFSLAQAVKETRIRFQQKNNPLKNAIAGTTA